MSSSFAWVDPAAKTTAAPKQVESRKLRIITSLLTTDGDRCEAHPLPPVGTRLAGRASGNVSAPLTTSPAVLERNAKLPAELTSLCRSRDSEAYACLQTIATKTFILAAGHAALQA
jgi:hypothetical protein